MFWYSGIVRRLIIAAKVKSDITALKRLMTIWGTELSKVPMIQNMHAVMPCPSSLWSRLHGRIDVTWFLAERISSIYRIPMVLPPRHTYWKMKKRSQTLRPVDKLLATAEPTSADSFQSCQHYSENRKYCLVVDDVVTTGTTLKTCISAAKMCTDFQFATLTFSKARHLGH